MISQLLSKLKISLDANMVWKNVPSEYIRKITSTSTQGPYEAFFIFVDSKKMFKEVVLEFDMSQLKPEKYLFILYPKLNNPKGLEGVHRDDIFPMLNVDDAGFVRGKMLKFNRMVSLDETYTVVGLKFMDPAKEKKEILTIDYSHFESTLLEALRSISAQAAEFYESLTPGYRRSWCTYIYSAKREATQAKRFEEVVNHLENGIKSKELVGKKKTP